jgi:hypothetical protein
LEELDRMDDKDAVLAMYPMAEADYIEPAYQLGQNVPTQPGYWAVTSAKELGAKELGRGATKGEAWADAASKLIPPPSDNA